MRSRILKSVKIG